MLLLAPIFGAKLAVLTGDMWHAASTLGDKAGNLMPQSVLDLVSASCPLQVVEDFGLLHFTPLAIEDREAVGALVSLVDKANGYVFMGLAAGKQYGIAPELQYRSVQLALQSLRCFGEAAAAGYGVLRLGLGTRQPGRPCLGCYGRGICSLEAACKAQDMRGHVVAWPALCPGQFVCLPRRSLFVTVRSSKE